LTINREYDDFVGKKDTHMRKIGVTELDDIALGAALLGSGGGGSPYSHLLYVKKLIKEYGDVSLISLEEVPDDAFIVPLAGMGAPSVGLEKLVNGEEYKALIKTIQEYTGREIFALLSIEIGGGNCLASLPAATQLGLPVVDADGMGRAFPEWHMVTFTLADILGSPLVLTDEKGNTVVIHAITNKWGEDLARAVTAVCGGSAFIAAYCMDGKTLKRACVPGSFTRCESLGKAIRGVKEGDATPETNFIASTQSYKIFKGKIVNLPHETRGAFNFGKIELAGLAEYANKTCVVEYQNENLIASVEGVVKAVTPDIIALVDIDTFTPITTETLRYGMRVLIVGLACFEGWRSETGLGLVGPKAFGYQAEYTPVELLNSKSEVV
jgi:DUF917 family protein